MSEWNEVISDWVVWDRNPDSNPKVPPVLHSGRSWASLEVSGGSASLRSTWQLLAWLDHTHNHTTAPQRNILVENEVKLKGGNQRETIFRERD